MTNAEEPLQLGVDLASTIFRAAYIFPDEERAVVPVPITMRDFQPCFPICERRRDSHKSISPFFPGLSQRISLSFPLKLGLETKTPPAVVTDLLRQTIEAVQSFSGRTVDGVLLTVPSWEPLEARALLRQAVLDTGVPHGAICNDADAALAYVQAEVLKEPANTTVLFLSAGYTGLTAALLRLTPRGGRILALAADESILAGNLLDWAILQATFQQLSQARIQVLDVEQPSEWSALQHRTERAKEALDDASSAEFEIPEAFLPGHAGPIRLRVHREGFAKLLAEHLERAAILLDDLLGEAGVSDDEVQQVLLEGGSTHLAPLRPWLANRFGKAQQVRHLPPDALAAGAARLATEGELDRYRESTTAAAADMYAPERSTFDGLVSLVEAPAGTPESRDPAKAPDEEAPIEVVTLAHIRGVAASGRTDQARRMLEDLRDALQRALDDLAKQRDTKS